MPYSIRSAVFLLADMAERKIQMNNRMLEMTITVNSPECCRACDNDESGPCPKFENACRELYSQAASSYVEERAEAAAEGFAFLAKNVLEDFEIFNIMSTLLDLEEFDRARPAVDMLYSVFCVAGLRRISEKLLEIRVLSDTDEDACEMFMDCFFDDEIIDSYAIDVIIADAENEVECEENGHGKM